MGFNTRGLESKFGSNSSLNSTNTFLHEMLIDAISVLSAHVCRRLSHYRDSSQACAFEWGDSRAAPPLLLYWIIGAYVDRGSSLQKKLGSH